MSAVDAPLPGASGLLARHVADTAYAQIPAPAIAAAKRSLVDAVGVTLAASGIEQDCRPFVDLAIESGGARQGTILGFGHRVPQAMAAFANGAMAHAMDFEDSHDGALVHPNAATVPAALAIAQARHLGGKDVLAAVAVGCDVVCRLGLAFKDDPGAMGWYMPPILGAFGATAAAARLLGLSQTQVLDALSLTLCQATCSAELKYSADSTVRAVRDAFGAKAGVVSAQLAARGVRGFELPFEGRAGLFALYGNGRFDYQQLVGDLGSRFEGVQVGFKPWPSCRGTHPYIEAAIALSGAFDLHARDIAAADVTVGPLIRMLCEPVQQKRRPATAIDAKFSVPFTVATALCHRRVGFDHFLPSALHDGQVLSLADKVRFEVDSALGWRDAVTGSLTLTTHDGRTVSKHIAHAYGHPSNPMSDDALAAKFLDCARHAVSPVPMAAAARFAEQVQRLEQVDDINDVIDLLHAE